MLKSCRYCGRVQSRFNSTCVNPECNQLNPFRVTEQGERDRTRDVRSAPEKAGQGIWAAVGIISGVASMLLTYADDLLKLVA